MPDRFAALWNGEGEPGATARLSLVPPAREAIPTTRFRAFVATKVAALPQPQTRRDLDRLIVKLCWKLHAELAFARTDADQGQLLRAFAEALDAVELRRLEVEPPDLVEQVVVRDAAPPPTAIPPRQVMGLIVAEDGHS